MSKMQVTLREIRRWQVKELKESISVNASETFNLNTESKIKKSMKILKKSWKYSSAKNGTVKKVHSLIDKVYHPTNLKLAWERVKANKGKK
ncbi:hypothetical protein [Thermanaerosceptrum fracticalcis]|uniref:hypothetical protein n=1 Tax=Thermanaerosceptrum fracticalcis TaxID=1712410 RepID=UPI001A9BC597|nr:hypothetical protein [Thermanaerosceptrum fracticalcis]